MSEILDARSSEILRHVVEAYLETREPLGSLSLSKRLGMNLSPATIRNVMADLEEAGFLFSPHTSAGRLPTEAGLRFFLNGFLEFGSLSYEERQHLTDRSQALGKSLAQVMEEMTLSLSGLSQCAGLVLAPKTEIPLKHIEFVFLNPGRAMVILITEDGMVENRIIDIPKILQASQLTEASNYLNNRLAGKNLEEGRLLIDEEILQQKTQLDALASQAIAKGLASWGEGDKKRGALIVRGQSQLLKNVRALQELENLQKLFTVLDTQEAFLNLLDATIAADGVQIFIGSENPLFNQSGCSLVISPYSTSNGQLIGAIGVLGPTYMNYKRIIPLVDYTARLLGRILD